MTGSTDKLQSVLEGGRPIAKRLGVEFSRTEASDSVFDVEPGGYFIRG